MNLLMKWGKKISVFIVPVLIVLIIYYAVKSHIYIVDKESFQYFFSTIAQVIAALIGILGIFIVFSVELYDIKIKSLISEIKRQIEGEFSSISFPTSFKKPLPHKFPSEWNLNSCIIYLDGLFIILAKEIFLNEKKISANASNINLGDYKRFCTSFVT